MYEDMAARMARVIVEYSTRIQPGDVVVINAPVKAAPLVESLYEAVLRAGGNPLVSLALPSLQETYMNLANDDQLDFMDPMALQRIELADVYMVLQAPANKKAMASIAPERLARAQKSAGPLMETLTRRMGEGLRYMATPWPTDAAAQEANMGLLAYTGFVYKACALHHDDPVAHWQAFRDRQMRLSEWLADKEHCEVRGPGIDLSFNFKGRVWYSAHGEMNFPDGEIFTGPVEDSVNGHVEFSYPSLYMGQEVRGVQMTFKDGVVVEASAEKGEGLLMSQLDADEGSRRLGEFAIGTNLDVQQYTGDTLFDEKIGGTIHMAIGASIPMTGGVNQSRVHWDIVHGMQNGGEIFIDGELFYRSGEFVIEA